MAQFLVFSSCMLDMFDMIQHLETACLASCEAEGAMFKGTWGVDLRLSMIFLKNDLSPSELVELRMRGFTGLLRVGVGVLLGVVDFDEVVDFVGVSKCSTFFFGLERRLIKPAIDLSVLLAEDGADEICCLAGSCVVVVVIGGLERIDVDLLGGAGASSTPTADPLVLSFRASTTCFL